MLRRFKPELEALDDVNSIKAIIPSSTAEGWMHHDILRNINIAEGICITIAEQFPTTAVILLHCVAGTCAGFNHRGISVGTHLIVQRRDTRFGNADYFV
jgi:hypothetical protein